MNRKVQLGDLCDFINGGAWSDKEYVTTGIPVLKVSNFKPSGFLLEDVSRLPNSSLEKYKKHLLQKGDMVIATVGSHPNLVNSAAGRSCVITDEVTGYLLNQNAVCVRTLDSEVLDQKYLTYLGKSFYFQHYIQSRGKGAANQMRIAISAIKEYELELPDIGIQRRVAEIISAYDDLIENNQKQIKLLEEAAMRLYKEWFVKLRFPGHENTKIVDGVPEGWEKLYIEDVCQTVGGGTPSTKVPSYYNNGTIPWVTPTDITRNDCLILLDTEKKITEEGLARSSAKMLPSETILMTSRASVGFFGISEQEVCTNQGFISCIPNNKNLMMFLLLNLMSRKDEIRQKAGGATYLEINKSTFRKLIVIKPDDTLLNEFQSITYTILKRISALKKQSDLLKQARDKLLPKLMNGDIEV